MLFKKIDKLTIVYSLCSFKSSLTNNFNSFYKALFHFLCHIPIKYFKHILFFSYICNKKASPCAYVFYTELNFEKARKFIFQLCKTKSYVSYLFLQEENKRFIKRKLIITYESIYFPWTRRPVRRNGT